LASTRWKRLALEVTPELDRRLAEAARRRRTTKSALACRAFERFLDDEPSPDAVLGSLESGIFDLATRHREYVIDSIRSRR
jgi:hypothetical protein